jgi:hypothetical protein
MVLLAEEGYVERGMPFDQAWQEMLNHSTTRVSEKYHCWSSFKYLSNVLGVVGIIKGGPWDSVSLH